MSDNNSIITSTQNEETTMSDNSSTATVTQPEVQPEVQAPVIKPKVGANDEVPKSTKVARVKKVKVPNVCWCGCGGQTAKRFVPGHDARFHSLAKKVARGELTEAQIEAAYLNLPHDEARDEFTKHVDAERPNAERRAAELAAKKAEIKTRKDAQVAAKAQRDQEEQAAKEAAKAAKQAAKDAAAAAKEAENEAKAASQAKPQSEGEVEGETEAA